jgi:hypothetical protein
MSSLNLRPSSKRNSGVATIRLSWPLRRNLPGGDGRFLPWRRDLHQRKTKFLPFVKAAQQRPHVANAELAELQRHPGAGRFVRSSTEENDFPIAGDFAVPGLQFLRRDLQRARQGAGIGEDVQGMAQVDDDRPLARFQLVL